MPRNLCLVAVAGSASRRSVPPPNAWAIFERSSAQRDGALIPGSNRRSPGPTPPVCLRRLRRPRSPVAGGIDPPAVVVPAGRRLDPECRPDAPPPPAAVPGYPLRCGVFALSPSCLRRTLWAPFFSGFHRLAVDDGRTGCGLAALSLPQHGMQRVVGSLPSSIPAPSTEIMECGAPQRQVVGEHPPRAASAQHVADGVDDLAPRILDRPPSRFGWRQQRFQKLPLPVADIASISRSFHASTLQPTPRFLPSYHYPSYTLFRHPLIDHSQVLSAAPGTLTVELPFQPRCPATCAPHPIGRG